MFELVYFLLIGLAAGWLAGKIMTGQGFSLVGNWRLDECNRTLLKRILDHGMPSVFGRFTMTIPGWIE